ncbi:hydroxyacid dehydrogenase [Streptomyces cavernicola]|uniref:Hydroxyacid dehydrogenase n=1 Tax=Streptomyces cavernicola TaxID=3043613 RepID=A0ABT6SCE5_9ACTN|nr:hydroxyacid dehydrogenase [Streptomyces sp. B-S-A6]MDI3405322.1 hydroxyacid dehydrogenase [Streptomyces sp. B-S-A6]
MSPETRDAVFGAAALRRLTEVARVEPALLVTDFTSQHTLLERELAEAEMLLTGWGCPPLDRAALRRLPRLKAVVHAAGSVKGHVTEECWRRGIAVTTAAAANALPVAEYTLAAILFANKRVLAGAHAYRAARGRVNLIERFPDVGNYRRTVGLVGASRIGRRVIELLAPFDVRVLLHDPYVGAGEAAALGVELVDDLDALALRSDIVSLHAPQLPSTRHLFDAKRLALMPDGATLINTARGSLVDTAALTAELRTGRLHAVLDHTEPEVLPADSPLFDLPNVLLTPHLAGSIGGELHRLADSAIDELARYARGLPFLHAVDPQTLSRSA